MKSDPSPRKLMRRPSPPSRLMATPGRRCSDSAKFRSGNFAISSAMIVSEEISASFLISRAWRKDLRNPRTIMTSDAVGSLFAAAGAGAGVTFAWAWAGPTLAKVSMSPLKVVAAKSSILSVIPAPSITQASSLCPVCDGGIMGLRRFFLSFA